MAVTPSSMSLPLGTHAPDFELLDVISNQKKSLHALKSDKATVIMFICNHCPFVKHIQSELVSVANDYQSKGIRFIAINSNDVEHYPEDNPKNMQKLARRLNYPFPFLYDETQDVARAYFAACTPDFYVFDKNLNCVYRGRFDDASPGKSTPVTGKDLRQALNNVLAGKPVDPQQKPSYGCNIKWRQEDQ